MLKLSRQSRNFILTGCIRRTFRQDTESEWSTWISKYRLTVNHIFRDLTEHNSFQQKALESSIDLPNWKNYVNRYRRDFIRDPVFLLGSVEKRNIMCDTVENIHTNANASSDGSNVDYEGFMAQVLHNKQHIFETVLQQARLDLSDVIEAHDGLVSTSDLRIPHEWYPKTRLMRRKIIYHGGPTNSGKALQRLKSADIAEGGGLYCGPLRLLALEVYENLNRQGVFTNLMTGQEKREVPEATHTSCTVEMVNLDKMYDVAVIDEIQMIGNKERGYAWTRALQGLQAREIHVCGGLEAADIVSSLAASTGDDFELRKYDRLSTLVVNEESLRGDYSKIRPGDCIVAFSKADIFSIRKQVEQHTPFKCAIIYGQLPPETRSTQARLFNENNSGYDVLVASDAIGMGLNLNIRRIIFHNTLKGGGMNGVYWVDPSSVKQIAGRAGRMSSDYKIGEVSAWQDADLAYVRAVMAWDIPQIQAVGVFPSVEQIELFSSQLTKTLDHDHIDVNDDDSQEKNVLSVPQILVPVPATRKRSTTRRPVFEPQPADLLRLSMIVERFVELSKTDARYFICDYEALLVVSNWLHTIPMSVADKYLFSTAPVNIRDGVSMHVLYDFAATYALQRPVPLKVRLSKKPPRDLEAFSNLCIKHNALELYLWLSFRFPKYFIERDLCLKMKEFAVGQIEATLMSSGMSQSYNYSDKYKEMRIKLRNSGRDQYPPEEYGVVRDTAKILIDALDPDLRFVSPPVFHKVSSSDSFQGESHGRRANFSVSPLSNKHKFPHKTDRVSSHSPRDRLTNHIGGGKATRDLRIDRLTATD